MEVSSAREDKKTSTTVCPESTLDSADRRGFIRKAAILTAAAGLGGSILHKPISLIPESSAESAKAPRTRNSPKQFCVVDVTTYPCCNNYGNLAVFDGASCVTAEFSSFCYGPAHLNASLEISSFVPTSCCNTLCCYPVYSAGALIVSNTYECPAGFPMAINGATEGISASALNPRIPVGVMGTANKGVGVLGQSSSGPGIEAISSASSVGIVRNNGKGKNNSALIQFENGCSSPTTWYEGVGGVGNTHGLTNGQFFLLENCEPMMVVNKCGKIGIGTIAPNATLQVNGGVSLGTKIETSNYTMASSDFAVLANASSKAIKITLPLASNTGQLVHVKKIDSSNNVVTVGRQGSDTIEGSTSKPLSTQY